MNNFLNFEFVCSEKDAFVKSNSPKNELNTGRTRLKYFWYRLTFEYGWRGNNLEASGEYFLLTPKMSISVMIDQKHYTAS